MSEQQLTTFLQQIITALSVGAVYALIALGYTMVYGVLRFINFAHSDVFMVGAYIGFFVYPKLANVVGPSMGSAVITLIVTMIGCGILGVTIEFLAYRPLRSRPKLAVLITAIGVSLFLEYTGQALFTANTRTYPTFFDNPTLSLPLGLTITQNEIIVIVATLILMFVLQAIVQKTKIGTAMRALSQNIDAAAMMGINTNVVITFTFFLGSALAGAGATLYSMLYPKFTPLLGMAPGLKAFVAAVLGGIGNIVGAAVGGLIIGTADTLTTGYLTSTYRDAVVFGILILVLIFKPTGIFGKGGTEKV